MRAPRAKHDQAAYLQALGVARERSASLAGPSLAQRLARLPKAEREEILSSLTVLDKSRLAYHWPFWARPAQNPDLSGVKHRFLYFQCGRGFGKSRTLAERVKQRVYAGARHIAFLGPSIAEIEKYMLGTEGQDSGILQVFHPNHKPVYIGQPKALVRFHTGAVGYCVSAETPEFRGATVDTVVADELGKWRYLDDLWANMAMTVRAANCKIPLEIIAGTTPLPLSFLKALISHPLCVTIIGNSEENEDNVDELWLQDQQATYAGTRYGRQELGGEILDDNPDALFSASRIEATRTRDGRSAVPEDLRVVVSVDPAIATGKDNDETGILVLGDESDGHIWVLADRSGRYSPKEWGEAVRKAYDDYGAVAIVCERNRGGDLVEANVRAAMERKRGGVAADAMKVFNVHATRGKAIRAEPVSNLHELGRIHISVHMPELESELTEWNPKGGGVSPNRLDALVWGVWYLGNLGDAEAEVDYKAGFKGLEQQYSPPANGPALRPSGPLAPVLGVGVRNYPARRQLR